MLDAPVISAPEMCPRAPRSPCNYAVTIQRGMSRTSGVLTNISASGGYLELNSEEEIGSMVLLLIRFNIPDSGRVYVSISSRICRRSEKSGVLGYGIQWIQATCDDRPEGIRHLVEKVLVGTTGRIQVLRNRENTDRIAYTFDFAGLSTITKHALELSPQNSESKSIELSDTLATKAAPEKIEIASDHEENKLSNPPSRDADSLSPLPAENSSTDLSPNIAGESDSKTQLKTEERVSSSSGKVFALGGNDPDGTPQHHDEDTVLEEKPAFTPVTELREHAVSTPPCEAPKENVEKVDLSSELLRPASNKITRSEDHKSVEPVIQPDTQKAEEVKLHAIKEDRRSSKRSTRTHQLTTTMVIRGTETDVLMRNISTSGALIQTRSTPPEINSTLTLKIQTPSQRRAIRINGTVVRIAKQESRNCQFAIRFSDTLHRGHAIELKKFFQELN